MKRSAGDASTEGKGSGPRSKRDVSATPHDEVSEGGGIQAKKSSKKYTFEWLVLHCLGFGACWGWVHIAFFSTILWGDSGEALSLSAWLINVGANGLAMVVLGCTSIRIGPLGKNKPLVTMLVLFTLIGTIGLAAAESGAEILVYAGAASSGFGTAGLLLLWAEEYAAISPTYAKKYTIPLSMGAGVFYYLLINMLPGIVGISATALLPVISIILLISSRRTMSVSRQDFQEGKEEGSNQYVPGKAVWCSVISVRFLIFTAVYCLAPGFMRGHTSVLPFASSGGIGEVMFSGVALVMIIVAVASIIIFKGAKIDQVYKLVVPLMAAGLLLLPFLSSGDEAIAAVAIMSGYILFEMYIWASLTDMTSNVNAPPALVFGLGKVGMNIGLLLGSAIGLFFGSSSTMLMVGMSVLIIYLFIVIENVVSPGIGVTLSLEVPRSHESKKGPEQEKLTIEEAAKMDMSEMFSMVLNERCEKAAQVYGLSQRETEVLKLLARGRSLQAIADSFGIAYSTVKTHTDRIYTKTGVHSRQELISLLEGTG